MPQSLSHREIASAENGARGNRTNLKPRFICSEAYRATSHGSRHPLAIPRVALAMDICQANGWLNNGNFIDSPCATKSQLTRFHEPAYVAAVEAAEKTGKVPEDVKWRHHLGVNGNPLFDGMFWRSATACGGGPRGTC